MSKIIIAADHAGFKLKELIKNNLANYHWNDLGCLSEESVDYPDYANLTAQALLKQETRLAILICGSGIGMSIAANRYQGIRAALCCNPIMAKLARQHNDANILVLGAKFIKLSTAIKCIKEFFLTDFEGNRHLLRINKIL